MVCDGVVQLLPTVKLNAWSAAIASGGSLTSVSVTWAAVIVTVQLSSSARSDVGSIVHAVGPPDTAAVTVPLVVHVMSYQPSATATGSLNVTWTLEPAATFVAPFAG